MSKREIKFTATSCADCEFNDWVPDSGYAYCKLTHNEISPNVKAETFNGGCPMGQIAEDKNETNR